MKILDTGELGTWGLPAAGEIFRLRTSNALATRCLTVTSFRFTSLPSHGFHLAKGNQAPVRHLLFDIYLGVTTEKEKKHVSTLVIYQYVTE